MSNELDERKRLFRMVRDIPYRVATTMDEQGYECVTKPLMLDKLLQTQGLASRHIICEFRWEAMDLPEKVMKHTHEDPETHEYLEIWIPEKSDWVKVDPSWDSRIEHPDFPTAEWDGESDTVLAVEPVKTYSPEESRKFIEQDSGDERKKYLERNREFLEALNRWLNSIRQV